MCGTASPGIEPLRPLSSVPDEFTGADPGLSRSDSQQKNSPATAQGIDLDHRYLDSTDGRYVVFLQPSGDVGNALDRALSDC
jgi:hypothetical protein